MNQDNATQNAFPFQGDTSDSKMETNYGLTKREYFAAMAMQGLITAFDKDAILTKFELAQRSVVYADELLKQLDHDR